MPRILFIKTCATDRMCFAEGQTHDVPAEEAESMLRVGYAVEAGENPNPQIPNPKQGQKGKPKPAVSNLKSEIPVP